MINDFDSQPSVFQKITIMPRLNHSIELIDSTLTDLKNQQTKIRKQNLDHYKSCENSNQLNSKKFEKEQKITLAIESLVKIQKKVKSISGINDILRFLPAVLPVIRNLCSEMTERSEVAKKLCEISVCLGSIAMDSGSISRGLYDFKKSYRTSSIFMDEVKLMVESKISKQYPNLDFL